MSANQSYEPSTTVLVLATAGLTLLLTNYYFIGPTVKIEGLDGDQTEFKVGVDFLEAARKCEGGMFPEKTIEGLILHCRDTAKTDTTFVSP